jgi:hypothetical protein
MAASSCRVQPPAAVRAACCGAEETPMTILLFAFGFAAGMFTSYLTTQWELAQ